MDTVEMCWRNYCRHLNKASEAARTNNISEMQRCVDNSRASMERWFETAEEELHARHPRITQGPGHERA